jgi:hypothetical protein
MQTITKTRQGARARKNVGLIKFDGAYAHAQATSQNPQLYTFIDYDRPFSVSFFINLTTARHILSGSSNTWPLSLYKYHGGFNYSGWGITVIDEGSGQYTIRPLMRKYWPASGYTGAYNLEPLYYHRTYHIYIAYDPVNLFSMYVNGRKIAIQQAVPQGSITGSIWEYGKPDFFLGGTPNLRNDLLYFTDGYLGQVALFARTLREREIVYIKDSGGILPESAHKHCIAHYPCNQAAGRHLYANEFSYNYTRLPRNDMAQYVIQSENQYDLSDEISVQIFPDQERSHHLRIAANNGQAFYCYHANYEIKAGDNIGGHKIRAAVDIDTSFTAMKLLYSGGWFRCFYQQSGSWVLLDQIMVSELSGYAFYVGVATAVTHQSVVLESSLGKAYVFDDTKHAAYIADGHRMTKVARIEAQHALELQNVSVSDYEGFAQTVYRDFYTRDFYRPYQDSNHDGTPDQPLKAVNSDMAPAVNAVYFQQSRAQRAYLRNSDFGPTNEKGYTVLINFFHPYSSFTTDYRDCIFSKRTLGSSTLTFIGYGFGDTLNVRGNAMNNVAVDAKYFGLGLGVSQLIATLLPLDNNSSHAVRVYGNGVLAADETRDNSLNSLDLLNSDFNIAYDVYGNNRYYTGYIISFGFAKGLVTGSQVAELWNNSLLAPPKKSWKNLDWQCYLDFNQIYHNGSDYYLQGFNNVYGYLSGFGSADQAGAVHAVSDLRV